MAIFPFYTLFLLILCACRNAAQQPDISTDTVAARVLSADTVVQPRVYNDLLPAGSEKLPAAPGTKSVIFNSSGSRLYAMNLEGMSVYEFDQATKKIIREFRFKPTRGMGWDYNKSIPIQSYQEKPVEACLTHGDRLLWISLHNAEGVVPIWLDDLSHNRRASPGQLFKPVTVIYPGSERKDSFQVPLIITGKTPKVIARTNDDRNLLVSNWHSRTISILDMNENLYPFGMVKQTVPVSAIPRGIAVDSKNKRSYVAIMGGASIAVINNDTWQTDTILNVSSNPRHLVMDSLGHLFVSYNSLGTIACLEAGTGKTLFTASTHSQPRTIVLSKNQRFLFVTCYTADMVDVYKINTDSFTKVASLPCKGHPVGVDIFEDDNKLEAWVCSYSTGSITVFNFVKK